MNSDDNPMCHNEHADTNPSDEEGWMVLHCLRPDGGPFELWLPQLAKHYSIIGYAEPSEVVNAPHLILDGTEGQALLPIDVETIDRVLTFIEKADDCDAEEIARMFLPSQRPVHAREHRYALRFTFVTGTSKDLQRRAILAIDQLRSLTGDADFFVTDDQGKTWDLEDLHSGTCEITNYDPKRGRLTLLRGGYESFHIRLSQRHVKAIVDFSLFRAVADKPQELKLWSQFNQLWFPPLQTGGARTYYQQHWFNVIDRAGFVGRYLRALSVHLDRESDSSPLRMMTLDGDITSAEEFATALETGWAMTQRSKKDVFRSEIVVHRMSAIHAEGGYGFYCHRQFGDELLEWLENNDSPRAAEQIAKSLFSGSAARTHWARSIDVLPRTEKFNEVKARYLAAQPTPRHIRGHDGERWSLGDLAEANTHFRDYLPSSKMIRVSWGDCDTLKFKLSPSNVTAIIDYALDSDSIPFRKAWFPALQPRRQGVKKWLSTRTHVDADGNTSSGPSDVCEFTREWGDVVRKAGYEDKYLTAIARHWDSDDVLMLKKNGSVTGMKGLLTELKEGGSPTLTRGEIIVDNPRKAGQFRCWKDPLFAKRLLDWLPAEPDQIVDSAHLYNAKVLAASLFSGNAPEKHWCHAIEADAPERFSELREVYTNFFTRAQLSPMPATEGVFLDGVLFCVENLNGIVAVSITHNCKSRAFKVDHDFYLAIRERIALDTNNRAEDDSQLQSWLYPVKDDPRFAVLSPAEFEVYRTAIEKVRDEAENGVLSSPSGAPSPSQLEGVKAPEVKTSVSSRDHEEALRAADFAGSDIAEIRKIRSAVTTQELRASPMPRAATIEMLKLSSGIGTKTTEIMSLICDIRELIESIPDETLREAERTRAVEWLRQFPQCLEVSE